MAILPLNLARVSTLQWGSVAQQQISATQQQLLQTQNELSTGKQINSTSDDPGNAAIILGLQKTLDQRKAYSTNLSNAKSQLSEVDNTLNTLTSAIQQAQQISSANVGSDVSPDARAGAADVVQTLYTQVLGLANTEFGGGFLFGGDKNSTAPFVSTAGGVQFVGSTTVLQNNADGNTALPFQVSASNVFGAFSSQVQGSVDLTPTVSAATRLSDLRGAGGTGIQLGTIQLGNGTVTKNIDLSSADSLGDVVNLINGAAVGNITAAINAAGNGLALSTSGADNITVQDLGGGTSALDLGVARNTGAGAGVADIGTSVAPKVSPLTTLTSLRGGAGIDTSHGLVITNGTKSATINLSSAKTVEDLLNAVNGANLGVVARINSGATGIDIVNAVQGTPLTIGENGGTTASDLGIRSLGGNTPLTQLNNGKGVQTVPGGDFSITRTDGTTFTVSLTSARTVQDVIAAINIASGGTAAAGVGVNASLAATGNGISLTDSAGGAGTLTVTAINNSEAAQDLGLNVAASGGGKLIAGTDVNPVSTSGIFSDLTSLQNALRANDQKGITAAGVALQNDYNQVVRARGANGASVQDIEARQSQLDDQNTATTTFLSSLQDADFTKTVTQFQTLQTALQATLQSSAKVLSLSLLNFIG